MVNVDPSEAIEFHWINFQTTPEDFPLREKIGLRGKIATFESQFERGFDASDKADVKFLTELPLGKCAYGATECAVHSFICKPVSPYKSLPFCAEILADLQARAFKSDHLSNLHKRAIQFQGLHHGTQSDEIHTDPEDQFIFSTMGEDSRSTEVHKSLRNYVLKNHLYYALLHTMPHPYEEFWFCHWVILFALGVSPITGNLTGVVTHQVCHNLCD